MDHEEISELYKIIEKFIIEKEYKPSNMMTVLCSQLMSTMAMYGYSYEFFIKTIDQMKYTYPYYLQKYTNEKKKNT